MNVNDFDAPEQLPEHLLEDIFNHQHKLAHKYLPIEKANGLLQTEDFPVNIDDHRGQARIKDMYWRAVEELAEALEALDNGEDTHFYEELADAMHFLVECCLLADVKPHKDGYDLEYFFSCAVGSQPTNSNWIDRDKVEAHALNFVKKAGLACNCLKNKPWKQTQMLTDVKKFKGLMEVAFQSFLSLTKVAGFSPTGLYNMYMKKNQVNQFRQRSGY